MIEIRGKTVELPAIPARLVDLLQNLEPAADSEIDLQHTTFKWDAFPLAESYRVTIWRTERNEFGGTYDKESYTTSTSSPSLRLADVPVEEARTLGLDQPGPTGAWSVDARGRWLARSGGQRAFVVAGKTKPQHVD